MRTEQKFPNFEISLPSRKSLLQLHLLTTPPPHAAPDMYSRWTHSVLYHKQKCVQQNEAFGRDFVLQLLTKESTSLTYLSLHVSHLVLQLTDFLAVIQIASKLPFSHHLFILTTQKCHITNETSQTSNCSPTKMRHLP